MQSFSRTCFFKAAASVWPQKFKSSLSPEFRAHPLPAVNSPLYSFIDVVIYESCSATAKPCLWFCFAATITLFLEHCVLLLLGSKQSLIIFLSSLSHHQYLTPYNFITSFTYVFSACWWSV